MEEMPQEKQQEPTVSSDTEAALNGDGSHSPPAAVDGSALAENDLLGFSGDLIVGGTESTVASDDFQTPQETLASSTDLLDFASAPTSMSTSPDTAEEAKVNHEPTEDLLGFVSSTPASQTEQNEPAVAAISEGTPSQVANADDAANLLEFMSAPTPEQGENVDQSNIHVQEIPVVQDSNIDAASQSPQVLLDVFSSEPVVTNEVTVEPPLDIAPQQLPSVSGTGEGVAATVPMNDQGLIDVIATESPLVESDAVESVTLQVATEESGSTSDTFVERAAGQVDNDEQRNDNLEATESEALVEEPSSPESANVITPTESDDTSPNDASTETPATEQADTETGGIVIVEDVSATESDEKGPAEIELSRDKTKATEPQKLQNDSMDKVNDTTAPEGDSESMEDVDVNDVDTTDGRNGEGIQEDDGMAEVELDTEVQVQSPAVVARSEPPVLSESVTKKVQQVDPWQTDDVTANNDTTESSVPLNDETKAEAAEPSATMVDLPPPSNHDDASNLAEKDALLVELQSSLQDHMTREAEAEDRARKAEARMKKLEEEVKTKEKAEADLAAMKERLKSVVSDKAHLELELAKLRTARDEHERKEIVLSNRLNAAKKKEAVKADLAERLEDEVKELQTELDATKEKLANSEGTGQKAEKDLQETTQQMTERVRLAETALADERRLNEDRKKKMKAFIESKQEEVRQGKIQVDELNAELDQTNRLLREQNSRWKQLHAQWVQSQTRNRELQRDLNRIKKDSDTMHKMGGKMEMKLDKAAQQTEEHKNKRLTAKHELMTILRTLEGEREVSSRLRDSLKFTFTPKALSQQQLLKESLKDFDAELQKLSRRLGRPLPPSIDSPALFSDNDETDEPAAEAPTEIDGAVEEGKDAALNRSEIDSNHLISNLENETQRVSQCIMALTSSIERMHVVLDESGPNTCINALTTILMGGGPPQTGRTSSQGERSSLQYGQVPTS